ncbi:MAG TPA: glycosyltransferase family 9 protein [Verrucomicrobiae bacterium]
MKSDCRHFPGDRPCRFNKESGQTCPDCPHYAPHGKRILVVKLAALGDVLRTTVLLPGLKEKYPNSYIVWLTLQNCFDLLKGNPFIDELWSLERDAKARLAQEEFDLVICTDADKMAAGLAAQAKAPEKRGLLLDPRGCVVPATPEAVEWLEMGAFDQLKKQNRKTYQQIIYDICGLQFHQQNIVLVLKNAERAWAKQFLAGRGVAGDDTVIGVNLGGGGRWRKKQWKEWHFAAFAQDLLARAKTKVLLIGGPEEVELVKRLEGTLPKSAVFSGTNRTMREMAALIGACRVLLTGDSLGLHVATALEVPSVVLFGPTSDSEIELYGRGEKIVAPIGCVRCYLTDCDVDPDCMNLIKPEMVLAAIKKWV